MKVRFTGTAHNPQTKTLWGVTFPKGQTVDLSDNPSLAAKCAAMGCFEEVKPGRKPKAKTDDQNET